VGLFSWNPNEVSDDMNVRFAYLKAIEWLSLPLFAAQPVAPILLLWFPFWTVAVGVLVLRWFWNFVRYRLIGIELAPDRDSVLTTVAALRPIYRQPLIGGQALISLACTIGMLVHLKWPIAIITGYILFERGETGQAVTAALWPIITMGLQMFAGGGLIGVVQKRFLLELGFLPVFGNPSDCRVDEFYRPASQSVMWP
jgi:hypothetical protein